MAGSDPTSAISGWAGGGASVTEGALQTAYGLYLENKNKRPDYSIPSYIQQNLTETNQRALQGLPEAQKRYYIENLNRSNDMANTSLGSLNAGLRGVAGANNNLSTGYNNLLAQDSAARAANQNAQYGMRDTMANYTDKAFQLNKENPYYEMVAKSQGLEGAGMQNMSQGFQQGNTGGNPFTNTDKKSPVTTTQTTNTTPSQFNPTNNTFNPYSGGNTMMGMGNGGTPTVYNEYGNPIGNGWGSGNTGF